MGEQTVKLSWKSSENGEEINSLLRTLAEEYPLSDGGRGLKLSFRQVKGEGTVSRVTRSRGGVEIAYTNLAGAARGIGTALSRLDGEERTPFQSLGIMLDVSRNMVMKVDHFKKWLRRLALSGYNQVLLYCEDVYELEDEPFFGAFRGAYSYDELREIDAYAQTLGIEMVGCIQTLAHLEQILRHPPYKELADSERVMLVGSPEVAKLVDKMIAFWRSVFTSRRIHIGMDEAHGLGRGRYETLHGPASGSQLMAEHLKTVSEICRRHGLAPMMWSDMFFRLLNPEHEYYDMTTPFPSGYGRKLDAETQLVYWDYYHGDAESYRKMISRHRELGKEPIVASGIWTWRRLWYDHVQTMATAIPCIEACRLERVRELFFTMWGDDGAYCDYDSSLAGIVRCGDLAYGENDENCTADRFEALCGADYGAQIAVGEIHRKNFAPEGKKAADMYASMLFWDDPLLGIYYDNCKRIAPEFDLELLDLYDDILCRIMPHVEERGAGNIGYAVDLLKFLMRKLELRGALEAAYSAGDRLALRELCVTTIPAALAALQELDGEFRRIWLDRSKAFGLERIQSRNATLAARLEELSLRIREYLAGDIDVIEELEARLPWSAPTAVYNCYKEISGGSWII